MVSGLSANIGKVLRIDLTAGRIWDEKMDEALLRLYVGGTGLGSRFLYDEVKPGTEWDDPENRLILASGPLGGAKVAGSGSYSVVTKGPLTNGATSTQANGYFGAYLKFCGFDAVIIQGKANTWKYLYIHDGTAELLDATHILRHGVLPDREAPSVRYGSAPVDGPARGKSIMPHWNKMLDQYYQHMGWDRQSGRPLPETLREVGLENLIPDMW